MTSRVDLFITEEPSKDDKGKPCTIFYIREKPFRAGFSYQSSAMTMEAAEWVRNKFPIVSI